MKLLIVEADTNLKKDLVNFFINQNYELVAFDDGTAASIYLEDETKSESIDIVLCDLDSDLESGLNFLKLLQNSHKQIPFIFIANQENVHDIIHSLQRGMWNYLVKPILNLSTVLVIIEHLCHREQLFLASKLYSEQSEDAKSKLSFKYTELENDHISGYKLQQQLLPKNNLDILSLNFNYFLHPSLYISGDFIDFQQVTDRYVIFYLSDVSGHGVSSAFVTVLVKACIQQYSAEFVYLSNQTAISPKLILDKINRVVCSENLGKYLTMVYMVYDLELSKLTYSVAGHYPFPILIEHNKAARYIGERGYPLGMFPEAEFENYEIDLPDEFKLAIFSDGIMDLGLKANSLDIREKNLLTTLTKEFGNMDEFKAKLGVDLTSELPDDTSGLFVTKFK